MQSEKKNLYSSFKAEKANVRELLTAKHNAERMLGIMTDAQKRDNQNIHSHNNPHEILTTAGSHSRRKAA